MFFPKLVLPFAIPVALVFALLILVGNDWPRNIAPGSGLKVPGLGATIITSLLVCRFTTRGIADTRVHKMAALVCGVTGLLGWPVWSVGVLPSVNGISVGSPETVRMTLDRTEATTIKHSRALNHWAWLRPAAQNAGSQAERYFISEDEYKKWSDQPPRTVTVTFAQGLLGASIVTGFD
jgi:hypothetical protein